jgi:hypothetical protein
MTQAIDEMVVDLVRLKEYDRGDRSFWLTDFLFVLILIIIIIINK